MEQFINKVIQGDCLIKLKELEDNSVDSIVTDPPYHLVSIVKRFGKENSAPAKFGTDGAFSRASKGFMGKDWDGVNEDGIGIAQKVELWKECLRVLKPGGHLLAFSGTRTYHRMASAIEDAGFEVRDMIEWVYGSGFPKSLNIGKAVDKVAPRLGQFDEFSKHLTEQIKKSGKSQKEIASLFPSKTGGLTGCVWNWSHSANVPTVAQWSILKPLLDLSDEFFPLIERIEREREVVGKDGRTAKDSMFGIGIQPEWNITKGTSEWEGWGTALKPAHEPICMARKPLAEKTVAENCLKWGTGGINIDESRVGISENDLEAMQKKNDSFKGANNKEYNGIQFVNKDRNLEVNTLGRFPANLIHDNSEEVRECFPETKSQGHWSKTKTTGFGEFGNGSSEYLGVGEKDKEGGNASRFFKSILYYPKASKSERNKGCEGLENIIDRPFEERLLAQCKVCGNKGLKVGAGKQFTCGHTEIEYVKTEYKPSSNNHPTVKPIALMEYLIKMVTPKGGTVLDPFAGSGSTLVAAKQNGYKYIGIELTEEYIPIIEARLLGVENNLFKDIL